MSGSLLWHSGSSPDSNGFHLMMVSKVEELKNRTCRVMEAEPNPCSPPSSWRPSPGTNFQESISHFLLQKQQTYLIFVSSPFLHEATKNIKHLEADVKSKKPSFREVGTLELLETTFVA